MSQYSWGTCPEPVKREIETLDSGLKTILDENLVGLYLHGSLTMSCFNPQRSDVDILVLIEEPMPLETKRRIVELLLGTSNAPAPIEISFLTPGQLHPWRYPPPFDLHYGESWRGRYEEDLRTGVWRSWHDRPRTDLDLAAHITHLRDSGVRLHGPPIQDVFPRVPRADYLAAIVADYRDARAEMDRNPIYAVLNISRVYRYLVTGELGSKDEAGQWAMGVLPNDAAAVVEAALAVYRGNPDSPDFTPDSLERFAYAIDERMASYPASVIADVDCATGPQEPGERSE